MADARIRGCTAPGKNELAGPAVREPLRDMEAQSTEGAGDDVGPVRTSRKSRRSVGPHLSFMRRHDVRKARYQATRSGKRDLVFVVGSKDLVPELPHFAGAGRYVEIDALARQIGPLD